MADTEHYNILSDAGLGDPPVAGAVCVRGRSGILLGCLGGEMCAVPYDDIAQRPTRVTDLAAQKI